MSVDRAVVEGPRFMIFIGTITIGAKLTGLVQWSWLAASAPIWVPIVSAALATATSILFMTTVMVIAPLLGYTLNPNRPQTEEPNNE